ncbi:MULTISPECIES: ribose-phosphate diphosphokinase [unclassified Variovorax]|uniref:ribose-phosphate diphosphokinase n=1 Tax=unclassified Variovorax TaxID=663243 RepID=UPI000838745D|nr:MULTISPECIES: ribose-phosphate diphosphokinase [unclassified Variovorax]PNG47175.1 Ribose-phosphate pyrophosphokinase [Variovorax sp. B2]PNG48174.1 Ribose-phosphate pyrophosphokinase [Variovorax sp. B4]VTV15054.1 Ribose-phosphate pyrophosphokinase [Variovorax sp. WDL1]
MLIFSLEPGNPFGRTLADALNVPLSPHEERVFDDGERKLRPLLDPCGADAYVVLSLHGGPLDSPHDKLCRLLMFIGTLKDHGAARVTAVVPYLAYARKDLRTKPYDPLGLRYVAQWLESAGMTQLIVLEAHNASALQNAFRCPTIHLSAHHAFRPMAREMSRQGPIAVASPDPGGVKRALLWREALEAHLREPVRFAMVDKRRSAGVVSGGELVAGDVAGANVLLLDDLIAAGDTMQRAARALRRAGAKAVVGCAAHGLFVGQASQTLACDDLSRLIVTDSVPPFRLPEGSPVRARLEVASVVPMFAEALSASHAAWRHQDSRIHAPFQAVQGSRCVDQVAGGLG